MEARNITIVSTKNQNKYVVNTNATTLGELKSALDVQHIDYEGMTFYEGLSHSELLTNDAVLPHDVPYKGNVTNELVFMLTIPNKKIRSGANLSEARSALYDAIEEYNLREKCIEVYGKNFTQCKNSELMSLIEDAQADKKECGCGCATIKEAFFRLLAVLEEDRVINVIDADAIRAILDGDAANYTPKSSYSEKEIEEMFNFMD